MKRDKALSDLRALFFLTATGSKFGNHTATINPLYRLPLLIKNIGSVNSSVPILHYFDNLHIRIVITPITHMLPVLYFTDHHRIRRQRKPMYCNKQKTKQKKSRY